MSQAPKGSVLWAVWSPGPSVWWWEGLIWIFWPVGDPLLPSLFWVWLEKCQVGCKCVELPHRPSGLDAMFSISVSQVLMGPCSLESAQWLPRVLGTGTYLWHAQRLEALPGYLELKKSHSMTGHLVKLGTRTWSLSPLHHLYAASGLENSPIQPSVHMS